MPESAASRPIRDAEDGGVGPPGGQKFRKERDFTFGAPLEHARDTESEAATVVHQGQAQDECVPPKAEEDFAV